MVCENTEEKMNNKSECCDNLDSECNCHEHNHECKHEHHHNDNEYHKEHHDKCNKENDNECKKDNENNEKQNVSPEVLAEKLLELNDKYIRLYSEYNNYRRRTDQEKTRLFDEGALKILKMILPVVDDFQRAFDNFKINNIEVDKGIELIYNNLFNILKKNNISMIDVKIGDDYDDKFHEAILTQPVDSPDKNDKIISIIENGYIMNKNVIRYTKVILGKHE